ncbi:MULTISPECIES: helix-turn-helix domain-containing protein [unclassified Microbacterium]|uniref:helix-turn-helix domain-containing protein n=1 Tax=unclassified Microbacterium TaxID=2609290 RepID=UPI000C2B9FA2|nr:MULTISPECIES: helix-turn-helix transcriptional regulator [unclassified Microbacterium]
MNTEPSWREVAALITATPGSAEQRLPERIKSLRESHRDAAGNPNPLTHTELARRLQDVGWTTDRTTLWKIENSAAGNGRRKITIDELLAFAKVFGVTVAELLLPEGGVAQLETHAAMVAAIDALETAQKAWIAYAVAVGNAQQYLNDATNREQLRARFEAWRDDLEENQTAQEVTLWKRDVAKRIEQGKRPPEASLLMHASDEEIVASPEFRSFRQGLDVQPVYAAYDDVLGGKLIARDAIQPGRARKIDEVD